MATRNQSRDHAPKAAQTQQRAIEKCKLNTKTIGGYLIKRLMDYGLDDIFGIPGDFVLGF